MYALVHLSQHVAVQRAASTGADATAAAGYAGHYALVTLFPWAYYKYDAVLKTYVANLTDSDKAAAKKVSDVHRLQHGLVWIASPVMIT